LCVVHKFNEKKQRGIHKMNTTFNKLKSAAIGAGLATLLAIPSGAFAATVDVFDTGDQWNQDGNNLHGETSFVLETSLLTTGFGFTAYVGATGTVFKTNTSSSSDKGIEWKADSDPATNASTYLLVHFPGGTSLTGLAGISFKTNSWDDNSNGAWRMLVGDGTDWYISDTGMTNGPTGSGTVRTNIALHTWAKIGGTEAALMNGEDSTVLPDLSAVVGGLSYGALPAITVTKGGWMLDSEDVADNDFRVGEFQWTDTDYYIAPPISDFTGGILFVTKTEGLHPDIKPFVDLLESAGYDVFIDGAGSTGPDVTLEILNKASLIIFGNPNGSGDFDSVRAIYNDTTAPQLCWKAWMVRSDGANKLQWFKDKLDIARSSTGGLVAGGSVDIAAGQSSHPMFAGLSGSFVPLQDWSSETMPTLVTATAGSAIPLTYTGGTSEILACYFDAGTEFWAGGDTPAGTRLYFPMGADAGDQDPNVEGQYNLTGDGVTQYMNAVKWLAGPPPTPDVTNPVITLTGDAVTAAFEGNAYNDAGATASDDRDGDISGNIVVGGTVDVNTVGVYTLTYDVSDAAGNAAAQVSREVHVVAVGVWPIPGTPVPIAGGLGLGLLAAAFATAGAVTMRRRKK
jgi:hypothetical protein